MFCKVLGLSDSSVYLWAATQIAPITHFDFEPSKVRDSTKHTSLLSDIYLHCKHIKSNFFGPECQRVLNVLETILRGKVFPSLFCPRWDFCLFCGWCWWIEASALQKVGSKDHFTHTHAITIIITGGLQRWWCTIIFIHIDGLRYQCRRWGRLWITRS